jgi:hypothetical protein
MDDLQLSLKDESVKDIGQAIGNNANAMIPQSRALGPSLPDRALPGGDVQALNPFDSMMFVLEDIRDGIYSLVDKFAEGNSLEKEQIDKQEKAQDLNQVAGDGVPPPVDKGGDNKSFFAKAQEKTKELMGAGGFKGLLVKGGLIFGLLGIAKFLQKFGKEIAGTIVAIIDGIKGGYNNVKDFFTITIPEKFEEFVQGAKDFFTITVPEKIEEIKTFITDLFTKIKDKISEFFGMIKDFFVITVPEKFAEVKTIVTEWFTSIKDNVSDLFTRIKNFFVITIPEKVQLITDSITTWFTDIVTEVKGIFTKVKDFFVITVPTKVQEIKDSITTWFTNIKDEVVGLFTKAKDFVVVTVPEKMAEISKGISDKFTEIKDQIIDFAMAPFRKIGELFDNLLIGILESVENIPFIGGKAKEMKEAIIAKRETAAAEGEVNQIETGNLIDYGFDNNNNLTMNGDPVVMGTNSDAKQVAVAAINDGTLKEDEAQIVPTEDGFMVKRIVPATIEQGDTTTGGATGGNLNNESAEFVGAGNPTGGGNNSVVLGGNNTNNVSTISNTNVTEDTGPDDKFLKDSIYP